MILQTGGSASPTGAVDEVCGDCGAVASGNFCASCGADLRQGALGFLGPAVTPVRRSFPVVYLKLLRAPISATAGFAEDRTYRNYLSFALTGIAIYCLFIVPVVVNTVVPPGGNVHVSESMLSLMRALSQAGVYVGIVITFALAYGVFRLFASLKRPLHAYFKLFCLSLGFTAPITGAYEFVVTRVFHGTGLTAFNVQSDPAALFGPTGLSLLAFMVVMLVYYIGIHSRFWNMAAWKAALLYLATSWVSNQIGYYLMWYVGFYTARVLITAGIVTP